MPASTPIPLKRGIKLIIVGLLLFLGVPVLIWVIYTFDHVVNQGQEITSVGLIAPILAYLINILGFALGSIFIVLGIVREERFKHRHLDAVHAEKSST